MVESDVSVLEDVFSVVSVEVSAMEVLVVSVGSVAVYVLIELVSVVNVKVSVVSEFVV